MFFDEFINCCCPQWSRNLAVIVAANYTGHVELHVVSRTGVIPPLALAIADFQDGDLKFNPEGRNTGPCSPDDVCLCECHGGMGNWES